MYLFPRTVALVRRLNNPAKIVQLE